MVFAEYILASGFSFPYIQDSSVSVARTTGVLGTESLVSVCDSSCVVRTYCYNNCVQCIPSGRKLIAPDVLC